MRLKLCTLNFLKHWRWSISASGFWGGHYEKTYIDIKVFNIHTHASNQSTNIKTGAVLEKNLSGFHSIYKGGRHAGQYNGIVINLPFSRLKIKSMISKLNLTTVDLHSMSIHAVLR